MHARSARQLSLCRQAPEGGGGVRGGNAISSSSGGVVSSSHARVCTPTDDSVDPLHDKMCYALCGKGSSVDLGRREFRVLASNSRVAVVKL